MKLTRLSLAAFFAVLVATSVAAADYFPPRGNWDRKAAAELGVDAAKLKDAIDYAVANENPSSKDVAEELRNTFGKREPLMGFRGIASADMFFDDVQVPAGNVVVSAGGG